MKLVRLFLGLWLLLGSLLLVVPAPVSAQAEPAESIKMTTTYPTLEATSGSSYEFEIKLSYNGTQPKTFTLTATGPKDWALYITPSYPKDKRIKDIRLDPATGGSDSVLINATPPYWLNIDPGSYQMKLEAASGNVKGSIDLTAVVTARYSIALAPSQNAPYSVPVTAGKENAYSIDIKNDGTATVDDISFSADKPEGWTVTFTPDKVASIAAGNTQTIDVKLMPSSKTISGDYIVSLRAIGKQASATKIDIRATVETPTIWGWTGVGIIVVVVAGLTLVIMRFSRR